MGRLFFDVTRLSRRSLLAWLGSSALGLAFSGPARAQVAAQATAPLPSFTGPGANPYWNGVNPFVSYPQNYHSFVLPTGAFSSRRHVHTF